MAQWSAGRAVRALLLLLQPHTRAAPLTPRGPAASYGTSITSAKIQVNGVHLHYQQTGEGSHAVLLLPGMLGIRDVSKWSEKVKKPLEEMYGHKYFAKTCEAWVDGISRFAEKSDGNICQQLLPDIKCPTFIIHGEKDPLVPQAHAEYIHKHIKGSRLLLMPEGKHNLHLRFAEDFNRQVEDFLH